MAQQAGYGAGTGKNPLGITAFWPSKCTEAPMLWEHWITLFYLGGNSETSFQSNGVLFRSNVDGCSNCGAAGGSGREKLYGGGTNTYF